QSDLGAVLGDHHGDLQPAFIEVHHTTNRRAVWLILHRQHEAQRETTALQRSNPAALQRMCDGLACEWWLDSGVTRAREGEGQREAFDRVIAGDRAAVSRQRSAKGLVASGEKTDGLSLDADLQQAESLEMLRRDVHRAAPIAGVGSKQIELETKTVALRVDRAFPVSRDVDGRLGARRGRKPQQERAGDDESKCVQHDQTPLKSVSEVLTREVSSGPEQQRSRQGHTGDQTQPWQLTVSEVGFAAHDVEDAEPREALDGCFRGS